ncbi:PAS domain S-box protein [Atlanticothrix silvestris]
MNERTITLQQVNEQLLLEISERQIVEEQLRQSQEMLQLVIDNIPQFIFWKDRNFVFLGCNRNFARIAGVESPEDIIGKTDYDLLVNHEEADLYREFDARVMQTNKPEYQIIEPLQRANGQQVWLETNKVPLHDTRGNVVGILASFEEITERQKTQKALEKSEERFRFLAESIPQQVWIAQVSGGIEYINQRTIDYFDCNWEQILGWEWQQWLHPEDLPKYMVDWQKSLATGEPFEMECRWFKASDQTYRWHLARALPLHDQIGKIINWFGTNTDIHDHVSAEVALRESEEWFRNLAEARSDWVWEVDENAVYTYVSPKVRDILGYEPEAVLGKTPFELMPPEEAERVFKVFAPIAAAREPLKCLENINIHQDGHLVVLETTGIPVFDLEGKFRGYRGTDRDITARKQAESALQETQQRLQAILDNSSAVIYVVDTENQFLLVNHKFEQLFRTTQDQIAGKSIYDIWPPDIADEFAANNYQVIAGGIPIKAEEVVPQEDGLHTYLSVKSPLKDADGIPYAVCGISTDITDRKVAEESLLRFCQAIESTSDAICMADVTGKPIYVNSGFTELYEYTLEEFQAAGGALTIFQQPAELQQVLSTIYRGEPWRGEVTMRSRSGRIVQIYLRADAIKDTSGKILGTVATHTDVTQRRQAEKGLRLRDRAIAASSNGIIIADASIPNGPIIYVNPAYEYMTGYSAAEVIGQNFHLFQNTDVNQLGLQKLSAAMQEGKDCTAVLYNYRKDGSILWIELNISPVYDAAGILTHYIGIQTDITERKQAEIALLVSQQRLQYLLDSSPAVIYTSKPFGDYGGTFVSENVSTVLGYEAREMIEDSSFWTSNIHPEDLPHVFAGLSKVLDQGQYKLEYRFLHKDGSYRWLYDKGKLLRDDTGNPLELVGYLAEITDRKQLEQELRVALEKEKELGELKSRFVSMTSHEFRTPLSTILSSSELLEHYRQKWTEEKQLTHLHRIQTAVKRMTDMLNDVLIIGKVEAGRLEFRPKSLDLVAYCRHLVAETQLNLNNQRVTKFISQDESVSCCMDDKLLEHILGNLLSNAIKYSPANSAVEFTLTCQNGQAIFEIQDWGIGIPPEDLPRLFESFYRAHNVGNILGTGLGLAIVKRCVDIHQGTIFVTSTLGVSTLFTVTLPLNNQYIN